MAQIQQTERPVIVREDGASYGMNVFARIIGLVGAVIIGLLTLRFVLALFGANPANAFADFVYDTSAPLVSPFFGLFNYTPEFGIARFEFETLIAILFYALLFGLLKRLVTVGRRDPV